MNRKKDNPISKSKKQSKVEKSETLPNFYEKYLLRRAGMNEDRAISLANHMILWFKEHLSAQTFEDYFVFEDINVASYYRWKEDYECIQFAHEEVEKILGLRRETEAKERDNKFLTDSMHLYSYLFKKDKEEQHKRKLELKAISAAAHESKTNSVIQVIIPPIENSPIVPKKDNE